MNENKNKNKNKIKSFHFYKKSIQNGRKKQ